MKRVVSLYLLIICYCFCSCNHKQEDANGYMNFIENENNALLRKKQIGDLVFQLQYCPTEYLLLKQLKTVNASQKLLDEKMKENDSLIFFKLRIKTTSGGDILNYHLTSNQDYYPRVDYLSYGFEEDIAFVSGKDTLFPGVFEFERNYGISPNADFMIAFHAKLKKEEDFQVVIDDKIFNTGMLKFAYQAKDIQNIPQLKTN